MKNIEKMSNREMRDEIRQLRVLLEIARCPNLACLEGSIPHQIGPEEWEAEQCQWCYERNALLAGMP